VLSLNRAEGKKSCVRYGDMPRERERERFIPPVLHFTLSLSPIFYPEMGQAPFLPIFFLPSPFLRRVSEAMLLLALCPILSVFDPLKLFADVIYGFL
jgi:hypothetical protein